MKKSLTALSVVVNEGKSDYIKQIEQRDFVEKKVEGIMKVFTKHFDIVSTLLEYREMDLQDYNNDEINEFIEKFNKRWNEKENFIKSISIEDHESDNYEENPNYYIIQGLLMGEAIRKYIKDIYKMSNETDTKELILSRLNSLFDYVLQGKLDKSSTLGKKLGKHIWF